MAVLIKPRTTRAALDAARAAADVVADLEAKAAAAHAEAARIDDDAVDVLVEDPTQAERIGREVEAQRRLASAYTTKAGTERAQLNEFTREALRIESERLDKHATDLDKKAREHQARVDELLAQLEDLDGVSYQVAPLEWEAHSTVARDVSSSDVYPNTRTEDMEADAMRDRFRASLIRYVLEHGNLPETANVLDYQQPSQGMLHVTMNSTYIAAHREYFVHPLLSAFLAGTALDYTPEA